MHSIPSALYQDRIFGRCVCPITLLPIRHPVGDSTIEGNNRDSIVYERSAIEEVIRLSHRSPISRKPLTVAQLVPKPAVQRAIDDRLMFYEQGLRKFAQEIAPRESNAALEQAAIREVPDPRA